MSHKEERKLAESKMNLRKNSQAILENLKRSIQVEKGINGMKTISSTLEPIKGDASKVDINKPNQYGFSTNYDGFIFCDLSRLQDQASKEEIKKRSIKEKRSEENIRFDLCGFPESQQERDFILNHNFEGLEESLSTFKDQWLYFHGYAGRGKTSRAIRIAWESIKDRYSKKATFLPVGPWIDAQMPKDGVLTDTEMEIRNSLRNINGKNTNKIVVLDDFDKFNIKSQFQSNHLFNLIDQLKNRDCKVIITSNRSIQEIECNCNQMLLPVMDRIKSKSFVSNFKGDSLR